MKRFTTNSVVPLLVIAALLSGAYVVRYVSSSPMPAESGLLSIVSAPSTGTPVDRSKTDDIDMPNMQQYTQGTPGVPVYTGAKIRSEDRLSKCKSVGVTDYITPDKLQKVEAFYKEVLPKRGWISIGEDGPAEGLIYNNYLFTWQNTSGNGPSRLYLIVALFQEPEGTDILGRVCKN